MKTIYVANLPDSLSENEVKEVFSLHGTVHGVKLIMDRITGKPRGFGFVQMPDHDALIAIRQLNASTLEGHVLRVDPSEERVFS